MIGATPSSSSSSKQDEFADLLREARELVMQCRAAPSLSTGMYPDMLVPPLQRGLDQVLEASARLPSTLVGTASARGYELPV